MAASKALSAGLTLFVLILSRVCDVAEGQGGGYAGPVHGNLRELTPQVVKPMFDSMRQHGEDRLREETKGKPGETNQFILVLVLSEFEIGRSGWTVDRVKSFEDKGRYAFLLNTDDHNIEEYKGIRGRFCGRDENGEEKYSEHKLHGEILFLKRYKRCMLASFKNEFGRDSTALLVMYSHYIPCACIQNTPYSCSEELTKVMKQNTEYQLLVAFTSYYCGTNAYKALRFLKEGDIALFQSMFDGWYGTFYTPSSIDNEILTLQGEMYQCLLNHPLSLCCTGEEPMRNSITAYFVNFLTYECTRDFKAHRIRIPDINKGPLSECMGKEIDKHVGDDCEPCSRKNKATLQAVRDDIKHCVYRSLEVAQFMGKPLLEYGQDLVFGGSWVIYEGAWKNIYCQSPTITKEQVKPPIMCAKGSFSLESLCTALERPQPETEQLNKRKRKRGENEDRAAINTKVNRNVWWGERGPEQLMGRPEIPNNGKET